MRSGRPVLPRSIAGENWPVCRLPPAPLVHRRIGLQPRDSHGSRWHRPADSPWDIAPGDNTGLGTERWL